MTPSRRGAERVDAWLAALDRRPRLTVAVATVFVALPLLVALIDLRSTRWYPVLDLAMTEFRVRDVFGPDTPLIGLPGRIGEAPNQGSHPGPLSFYLLAPVYRVLGASAWALQAAAVAAHVAAIATALWIARRRLGARGVVAIGAVLAVLVSGYGQDLLTQPWNPYLPLFAWIVVLLAGWSVLDGDPAMAVVMVVAGTLCAQTHVPYLVPAGALTLAAIGYVALADRRAAVIAVAVGGALWLPPVVDQLTHDPGNIRRLVDHFSAPDERVLGVADGVRLALRHFDVWNGFVAQVAGGGQFVVESSAWVGGLTVTVWAAAATVAWRSGPRSLRALHVVVAAALALGTLSITRIFGLPWYYLTLWAWGIAALAVAAIAWTVQVVVAARFGPAGPSERRDVGVTARSTDGAGPEASRAGLAALAATVGFVAVGASTVSFADAEIPEPRLTEIVAAVAGPTAAALDPETTYVVRWSDAADMGSPGYGLLDELERRGFDVGGDRFFAATITDHRVVDTPDSEIHLATGGYVDAWRAVPEAVEVATYERRDAAELAEYGRIRADLVARLEAEGLGDLVPGIDANLFGVSLDSRLSAADRADFTRLLDLGQPVSVFVAPPGADPLAL